MNFLDQLAEKPWLTAQESADELRASNGFSLTKPQIGLRIFLAVVTVLFSLFVVAYLDRMVLGDWRSLPDPSVLWLNTAVLVLSSVALQWARTSARRGQIEGMRIGLFAGGALALAFLIGQLWAWQQLVGLGYFAASNPANAFFYLVTAVHGVHMLGGLVALGRTVVKVTGEFELSQVRSSLELCAVYWHFLLVIWLVLFGLLLLT